jgi:methionine-S-sulfoxide reductase
MVGPFANEPGVIEVISGYTGGSKPNPTYEEVCAGDTGHYEAVNIIYDPEQISYDKLLDIFWRQIDPTDPDGQFNDRGSSYRTAIFYHDEEQRQKAEASKQALASSGRFDKPIVTSILPASEFYPAEDYHQDYYKKHPYRYKLFRMASGRDRFIETYWSDKN